MSHDEITPADNKFRTSVGKDGYFRYLERRTWEQNIRPNTDHRQKYNIQPKDSNSYNTYMTDQVNELVKKIQMYQSRVENKDDGPYPSEQTFIKHILDSYNQENVRYALEKVLHIHHTDIEHATRKLANHVEIMNLVHAIRKDPDLEEDTWALTRDMREERAYDTFAEEDAKYRKEAKDYYENRHEKFDDSMLQNHMLHSYLTKNNPNTNYSIALLTTIRFNITLQQCHTSQRDGGRSMYKDIHTPCLFF